MFIVRRRCYITGLGKRVTSWYPHCLFNLNQYVSLHFWPHPYFFPPIQPHFLSSRTIVAYTILLSSLPTPLLSGSLWSGEAHFYKGWCWLLVIITTIGQTIPIRASGTSWTKTCTASERWAQIELNACRCLTRRHVDTDIWARLRSLVMFLSVVKKGRCPRYVVNFSGQWIWIWHDCC